VRNVLRRLDSAPHDPRLFAEFLDLTRKTDAFYGFEPLPEYSYYLAAMAAGPSGRTPLQAPPSSAAPQPDVHQPDAFQPGAEAEASSPYGGPCPYTGERRFSVFECIYGWIAAFYQQCTAVTVRIRLVPDAGITDVQLAALRATWEAGIVNKWSGHFVCVGPYGNSSITFAVQWVDANPHHTVRVRVGPARSDMTTWDTNDTGDVAAHEFGHMIGNPDEYADAACPSRNPVNTGTVMDNNTGAALQRQVDRVCSSSPLVFSIGLDLI
jgi:hypothetical protein